ncbi:MAG: DNA ligase [Desulfobulbus sp.]|nr:DNA ligase [Desulfobulbus sp.]
MRWPGTPTLLPIKSIRWLLCLAVLVTAPAHAGQLMLPEVYTKQVEVTGWLMSEKLDGVRAYWDGKHLLSKNGNVFYPPMAFIQGLPPFSVEGEIWGGRGSFEQTVSIVKKQEPHDGWLKLKMAIFDVPEAPGGFTERIAKAKRWFTAHPSAYAFVIPQTLIKSPVLLGQHLDHVEELGGEGLIIRKPDALYTAGRSTEILKVKKYQTAEAVIIAHLPGKRRNKGRLGALLVEADNGMRFKIGSGFSDAERDSPPPVASVITFKYYGKYQSGIPKFASFLRIRSDQDL